MKEIQYIVCTRCFTFNHASYINQTLQGFVSQNITYPVLFVVVDDASTDGEQLVLKQWVKENLVLTQVGDGYDNNTDYGEEIFGRHKEKENQFFLFMLLKDNHYSQGKFSDLLFFIEPWTKKSKYQAICEGDDYWTKSDKLQKQVLFMDSHLECSACATNSLIIGAEGEAKGCFSNKKSRFIDNMDEIVIKRQFHTASALWREPICFNSGQWDTHIWCMLLTQGKIWYDETVSCVYRKAGQGVTEITPKINWIDTNEYWSNIIYKDFGEKYLSYYGAYLSLTRDILSLLILNNKLTTEERKLLKKKYSQYANWKINLNNITHIVSLYRNKMINNIRGIFK